MTSSGKMRLARFLALAGIGSRRACEKLIEGGRVQVNNKFITTPAFNVEPETDTIVFDGFPVNPSAKKYVKLFKPPGYTCSAEDKYAEKLVYDLIPQSLGRLFTIGRLDRDSEGLILMTNDGDFAHLLMHPRHQVTKTYHVWCRGKIDSETINFLQQGVEDEGEFLKPERVRILRRLKSGAVLEMILTEGKKREIRRLCKKAKLFVQKLRRVAIANLELENLSPGQWHELTEAELQALKTAAEQ